MKRGAADVVNLFMFDPLTTKEPQKFFSCWNCFGPISIHDTHCSCCHTLQKPANSLTNYQILGLTPSIPLDTNTLNTAFKKYQKLTHPDKYATHNHQEKLAATLWSSRLNEAYETLKHPIKSIQYWLSIHSSKDPSAKVSPSVLTEIMNLEEIAFESGTETISHILKDCYVRSYEKALKSAQNCTPEAHQLLENAHYWYKVCQRHNCLPSKATI